MQKLNSKTWKKWNSQEHTTWQQLAVRQLPHMQQHGSQLWVDGIKKIELTMHQIPEFSIVNTLFKESTNWNIIPTEAVFADGQFWFETLAKHDFIVTQYIRLSTNLDYTPMPDIFHDAFGHLPFLSNERFTNLIRTYAEVMLKVDQDTRTRLGHIWWYTIEFGLIEEHSQIKILGAGIASSFAETQRVFSNQVELLPFDAERVGKTKEHHHQFHPQLFVLKSLEQLENYIQQFV